MLTNETESCLQRVLKVAVTLAQAFFEEHKISQHHGTDHAASVGNNALKVLTLDFPDLELTPMIAVVVAAVFHDLDDRKLFPNSKDNQNATKLFKLFLTAFCAGIIDIEECPDLEAESEEMVIEMITVNDINH